MNHVTGQDRRNEVNPQNNVSEVEEMETQAGTPKDEMQFLVVIHFGIIVK